MVRGIHLEKLVTFVLATVFAFHGPMAYAQEEDDPWASAEVFGEDTADSAVEDVEANVEGPNGDEGVEEMVVIGIERSLEAALEEKRRRTNLSEVITAEDIGQLPDENVAEVLENIPGVQITRDGGIGSAVSVRGSDQNRVEINGRGTLSDTDARGGVSFSDLPAALVRSLTVTKVPTADMVEGSIGGTINVKTYRGLKLKEPFIAGSFASEYADNSESWNENFSTTLGKKFEAPFGDLGMILTVSHINKTIREDALRVSPSVRRGPSGIGGRFPDLDGDGDAFDPYYYPGFSDTTYGTEDRDNTTVSGSLEWQATDDLKLFFDGTYNRIDNLNRTQSAFASYGAIPGNRSDREVDGLRDASFGFENVGGIRFPILVRGVIGGGIRNNFIDGLNPAGTPNDGLQIRPSNRTTSRNTGSYLVAGGGEWSNENWLVEFEASGAASKSRTNAFITTFQYNDPTGVEAFHSSGALVRVPFLYSSRRGGLSYGPLPGAGTAAAANLLNPDYYSLFVARNTETEFDNELFAQKVDVDRYFDTSHVSGEVQFGVRFSQRSTERSRTNMTTDTFPFSTLPEVDLSGFLKRTPGDFFDFNSDEPYLRDFLTPDADDVKSLRRLLIADAGLGANAALAPPQGFLVDENTYAGYASVNFETESLPVTIKGNVGLRLVHTDQKAEGNQLQDDGVTFMPVRVHQGYYNWLPSGSLVVEPIEDLQIRFGYAKILRRPSFSQLAPTFDFPLNAGQSIVLGDPSLRPTTAHQVDVGVEWYFLRGSVLSIGYFYKDLKRVIGQEGDGSRCNPIAVGAPTPAACPGGGSQVSQVRWLNQPGGKIQGVEIALQHKLNYLPKPFNGFGVLANYAYQDGDRDASFDVPGFLEAEGAVASIPLNFRRLSEHSYNVTVYYERPKSWFSGRLRYTWRSSFLISESVDVANLQPLYRDDRGQLNGSMSIRLTRLAAPVAVRLTFSGVNLLKARSVERAAFESGPVVRVKDSDRRFSIGIRGRY